MEEKRKTVVAGKPSAGLSKDHRFDLTLRCLFMCLFHYGCWVSCEYKFSVGKIKEVD